MCLFFIVSSKKYLQQGNLHTRGSDWLCFGVSLKWWIGELQVLARPHWLPRKNLACYQQSNATSSGYFGESVVLDQRPKDNLLLMSSPNAEKRSRLVFTVRAAHNQHLIFRHTTFLKNSSPERYKHIRTWMFTAQFGAFALLFRATLIVSLLPSDLWHFWHSSHLLAFHLPGKRRRCTILNRLRGASTFLAVWLFGKGKR